MFRNESKNYFFDISISTPDGSREVRLNQTLLRLCSKIEIVESVASDEGNGASSATITFLEADFLPDRRDRTPLSSTAGHGFITNRAGSLVDLRFDTEKGFTYVSPEELETGITEASRTRSKQSEPVIFLFVPNNKIKITWGTLEPRSKRTKTFQIGVVTYDGSTSGQALSLQCYDLSADMGRLRLTEGKVFVKPGTTDQPESLKQVCYRIAKTFGARLVFDQEEVKEYPKGTDKYVQFRTEVGSDTLPADTKNPFVFVTHMDVHNQLRELANNYSSAYELVDDPVTGEPVIFFTSTFLRFNKPVRTLTYRDPNGIMIGFNLKSLEGMEGKSTSVSAMDEKGRSDSEFETVAMTDKANANSFNPMPKDYSANAKQYLDRELKSNVYTAPTTDRNAIINQAASIAIDKSFMGYITVNTLGHPELTPDLYMIEGIGRRASTTYRIFQVQHTISSSGYACSLGGKTQAVTEGGMDNKKELASTEMYSTQLIDVTK